MEKVKIIVMLIELACFFTVVYVMRATELGVWSWQALSVYVAIIIMGLVNYAEGLYKS